MSAVGNPFQIEMRLFQAFHFCRGGGGRLSRHAKGPWIPDREFDRGGRPIHRERLPPQIDRGRARGVRSTASHFLGESLSGSYTFDLTTLRRLGDVSGETNG